MLISVMQLQLLLPVNVVRMHQHFLRVKMTGFARALWDNQHVLVSRLQIAQVLVTFVIPPHPLLHVNVVPMPQRFLRAKMIGFARV